MKLYYVLIYSADREKLHQPITFSFVGKICSKYNDQRFILGEMVSKCTTINNDSACSLNEIINLIASLYS